MRNKFINLYIQKGDEVSPLTLLQIFFREWGILRDLRKKFGNILHSYDEFSVLMRGPGNNPHLQMFSRILRNPQSLLLKTQLPVSACTSEILTEDMVMFSISSFCYPTFIFAGTHIHTLALPGIWAGAELLVPVQQAEVKSTLVVWASEWKTGTH